MSTRQITLDDLIEGTKGDRGPLLEWKWIIDGFPEFPGAETLKPHYCEETNLPFPQISEKQKTIAATNIFFPGGSEVQAFDMVLYEDQAARSIKYILNWQSSIQDPYSGGYFPASYYKRDMSFLLLNTKNEPIYKATARNAFPLGIQPLQLSYSAQDRHRISVNFACDAFQPKAI